MSCSGWGRAWSAGRTLAGHPRAAHRPTPCRCLAAGLRGGKTIPEQVAAHPQVFATLTAPSYGPVHGRRSSTATHCRCGHTHPKGDPALGTPLDPDRYDYTGAVLWNAHAPALWARFMLQLRRTITAMAGIPQRLLSRYAQVSYAKVAEYQRRGLIHFHAVIRLDGSQGGSTPPPSWATPELLAAAIRTAATLACVDGQDIDRRSYSFTFGDQIDTKIIQSSTFEGGTTITEGKVAGYVAKYATKGTEGATGTLDHRIKLIAELAQEDLPDHAARMIRTTWTLGALHLARAAWPRRHTPAPGLSTLVLALWVFDGIGLTPDLENLAALVSGPVRPDPKSQPGLADNRPRPPHPCPRAHRLHPATPGRGHPMTAPKRKSRANGEGTIYQRNDGRWEAACYVLADDGSRKRVRVYGITRKNAADKP